MRKNEAYTDGGENLHTRDEMLIAQAGRHVVAAEAAAASHHDDSHTIHEHFPESD